MKIKLAAILLSIMVFTVFPVLADIISKPIYSGVIAGYQLYIENQKDASFLHYSHMDHKGKIWLQMEPPCKFATNPMKLNPEINEFHFKDINSSVFTIIGGKRLSLEEVRLRNLHPSSVGCPTKSQVVIIRGTKITLLKPVKGLWCGHGNGASAGKAMWLISHDEVEKESKNP